MGPKKRVITLRKVLINLKLLVIVKVYFKFLTNDECHLELFNHEFM